MFLCHTQSQFCCNTRNGKNLKSSYSSDTNFIPLCFNRWEADRIEQLVCQEVFKKMQFKVLAIVNLLSAVFVNFEFPEIDDSTGSCKNNMCEKFNFSVYDLTRGGEVGMDSARGDFEP